MRDFNLCVQAEVVMPSNDLPVPCPDLCRLSCGGATWT